ncbi:acyl-CoA N-acyltransferase [Lophiotrema nucula]|uniref:Acyl-CoA N-acyltransferase n=1 Tax=Lophiotrema nucula TaxID=690887 RepID=A0A6A5YIQ9_9PLEO|nr:acyl-CoA N-acyltransferase [Lophiotrema nucula]
MSPTIRAIQQADKQAWLGLWAQYNSFYKRTVERDITDTTFTRFLDDSVRMYGAVAEDPESKKIIGFAHWYPHLSTSSVQDVVYLHDLFVDPEVRSKGVGGKLIEHVYEHAKGLKASSVYWHTQYFNHRAQLLYVNVADRTDFVVYRKEL